MTQIIGYIYQIQNNVNNKVYVGKTIKPIEQRYKGHLYELKRFRAKQVNYQTKLYPAMDKYGEDNFTVSLIEAVHYPKSLEDQEKYWIAKLNSIDDGYNISPGGAGGPLFTGHHHSKELKEAASKRFKGKPQDPKFVAYRMSRIKWHGKNLFRVQNLNTGEVFRTPRAADIHNARGSVMDAVLHQHRANHCWWAILPQDVPEYSEAERE